MKINETESLLYYNRFIWMVVVYAMGAYISMHREDVKAFSHKAGAYFAGALMMLFLVCGIIILIEEKIDFFSRIGIFHATYFWRPNTIITLVWSVLIFLGFLRLQLPNSRVINALASTTLGIYMLHDERLGGFWWQEVFHNASHANSRFLIAHIGIAVVVIYIVGVVIDLGRQFLGKYCDRLVMKVWKSMGGRERQ